MKIDDLSKKELISLIRTLSKKHYSVRHDVSTYLIDREREREEEKIKRQEEAGDRWQRLIHEYKDLLEPYDGRTIREIPEDVLQKARKIMEEAEKAKREFLEV